MADTPTRTRQIDAPALEGLSAEQAASWCGLSEGDWDERVDARLIPPGSVRNAKRQQQWHWTVVLAVSSMRAWIDGRLEAKRKREAKRIKEAKDAKRAT